MQEEEKKATTEKEEEGVGGICTYDMHMICSRSCSIYLAYDMRSLCM